MAGIFANSGAILYETDEWESRFIGVNIRNLQQIVSVLELYRKLLLSHIFWMSRKNSWIPLFVLNSHNDVPDGTEMQ